MATYVTKTHLENFTEKLLVNDKKIRDELKQEISNLPSGGGSGSSYTLPTASTTTLGGVKVDGTTVTINQDGVISATASGSGSYTLPKATDTTLGGVKVDNNTITVDSEGVISATQELPIGGTTGQMLVKKSETDYDVEWKDVPQGGSSVDVATTDKAGIVKPDGTSVTVDADGTIHATTDTNQIKQDIEDYMTAHPVSAEVGNKTVTEEKLSDDVLAAIKSKKILFADTVADINNLPLYDGAIVQTSGFYFVGDGGSATYVIRENPESNNLVKLINYRYKTTIETNDKGKVIINGQMGSGDTILSLAEPIQIKSGVTYTVTARYESGGQISAQINFTLEDNDKRSACSLLPNRLVHSSTWTATKDTTISTIRLGGKVGQFENTVLNIQIEEGSASTDWSRAQYAVNNHNIINVENGFVAVFTPTGRSISMTQLGYVKNEPSQDCHDVIEQFKSICYTNNKEKYELFIPGGYWYFSETIIENGRSGLIIHGLIDQVAEGGTAGGESTIAPFNDNQEYIWMFSKSKNSTEIVGGYDIKNVRITSDNKFCEKGIWLNFCCYSSFDGLYFHQFKGTPFYMSVGWENRFGYLNFRGVGYRTKDRTYSALEFHPNPISTPPSAISANYFDYFNFEGLSGNCFYFAHGCVAVHNEINNIQVEWSCYDSGYPSYIKNADYLGDTGEMWDDLSEDIEHYYLIKGEAGANYNPITIKNASISGAGEDAWRMRWDEEVDNGDGTTNTVEKSRIIRKSGLVGQNERYEASVDGKDYGIGVYFGQLSVIGDSDFPIYHSLAPHRSGCKVVVGSLERTNSVVPAKCIRHLYTSLPMEIEKFYVNQKIVPGKKLISPLYKTTTSSVKEFSYDKDSWSPVKAVLQHGSVVLPLNAKKELTLRMKYNITEEELQTDGTLSVYIDCKTSKGVVMCERLMDVTKAELRAGKYPINEWFERTVPNTALPPCECTVEFRFNAAESLLKHPINLDYVIESNDDRQYRATELNYKIAKNGSPVGTTAYCRDKRYAADSTDNGVMVVFNGKEWTTFAGALLSSLPNAIFDITQNLTNCTSSNSNTSIEMNKTFATTITADSGYTLDSVVCTMGGVEQTVTDGKINIAKVTDPVIVTATASIHHNVTNNLTNCVNSNTATYVIDGESYNATVTANDGYTLDSVTCTMGGVDQTVNDGVISITNVTGDIVITATATAI